MDGIHNLLYYSFMCGGEQPTPGILPKELQACEWIETTGTQCITLDHIPTHALKTKVLCRLIFSNPGLPDNQTGCGVGGNTTRFFFGTNATTPTPGLMVGCGAGYSTIIPPNSTDVYEFELDAENYLGKINGVNYITQSTFVNANYKFNIGRRDFGTFNYAQVKYLYLEYHDTSIDIILYPCYVKSGKTFVDNKGNVCQAGTPGMYDVENNIFYTNDGTGAFIVGPDIIL